MGLTPQRAAKRPRCGSSEVVAGGDDGLRGDVASDAEQVEQSAGGELDELVEVDGERSSRSGHRQVLTHRLSWSVVR
jgi:hypothetical protein